MKVWRQKDKNWWLISSKNMNLRFGNVGKGNWIYAFAKVGSSPSYEVVPDGAHQLLKIIFSAKSIKPI